MKNKNVLGQHQSLKKFKASDATEQYILALMQLNI